MKYAARAMAALVVVAAAATPAVGSPWQEVCVAIVAVGAALGIGATHTAATKAHLAATQAKDSLGDV